MIFASDVSSPAPVPPPSSGNSPGGASHNATGGFYTAAAFVDTWIAAPIRQPVQRPVYPPQYNGVGECPF